MYRAPVSEIAFTLKHVAGLGEALASGAFPEPDGRSRRRGARRGGPLRLRRDGAAEPRRRPRGRAAEGRRRRDRDGLATSLRGLVRRRLERHFRAGIGRRAGAAARPLRRDAGDVERRLHVLRALPASHHGGGRGARPPRQRCAEGALSAAPGLGKMDRDHEPDGAAGGLRSRRAHDPRRAARRTAPIASSAKRSSSPMASTISPKTSCISCSRGFPMRRRARAASRSSSCRNSSPMPTAISARGTISSARASSTSSASTARRPAR